MSDLPAVTGAYRHAYREFHAASAAHQALSDESYAALRRVHEARTRLDQARAELLGAIEEDA